MLKIQHTINQDFASFPLCTQINVLWVQRLYMKMWIPRYVSLYARVEFYSCTVNFQCKTFLFKSGSKLHGLAMTIIWPVYCCHNSLFRCHNSLIPRHTQIRTIYYAYTPTFLLHAILLGNIAKTS